MRDGGHDPLMPSVTGLWKEVMHAHWSEPISGWLASLFFDRSMHTDNCRSIVDKVEIFISILDSTLDKVESQMHQLLLFTPLQKNIKAKSKPQHAGSSTTPRSSTNKKRQQFRHRVAKKLRSRQDQQLEQLTALRTFSTVFRDGTGPFCAPASTPPFPAILSQLPTFSFLILPLLSTSFPLLSPLRLLINSSTISTSSIVCFENLSRFTTSRDCQLLNC